MDKIQNLHDLEYYGNILLSPQLVKRWIKLKPNNKELKKLGEALIQISLYVVRIQDDLSKHKEAISDYRYDKNKALLELQELKRQSEM
jgi:hypothetical protein